MGFGSVLGPLTWLLLQLSVSRCSSLSSSLSSSVTTMTSTSGPTVTVPGTKTAIVLVDPVTDWKHVVEAAIGMNHEIIAVRMPDVALPDRFRSFVPTTDALRDAGVAHFVSVPQRDVFSCVQRLQVLAVESNLNVRGVVPLSEMAVEVSDLIAACLGLPHNALETTAARRDKGLMKRAAASAGLRVAKHARVGTAAELRAAVRRLALPYPIVVKTPRGMSTTDVHVCPSEDDAERALESIVGGKIGPDGRPVDRALLEEYLGGTEFAVNLMALRDGDGPPRLLATDVWKYRKTERARYDSAEICNPGDHPALVAYARRVAGAVGVRCGAAHVELKAGFGAGGTYVDPIMIEVGTRLSGGRKAAMAQAAVDGWDPFASLIESHCGVDVGGRPSVDVGFLTPNKFVRHIFLPVEKSGRIQQIRLDTSSLTTLHSSAVIVRVGDVVSETTDIVSCAGFVWLVGERMQVDKETEQVLSSFSLIMEE